MSQAITVKIQLDELLYRLNEESLDGFCKNADNMAPSLVEYQLGSIFEEMSYNPDNETFVPIHKVQKLLPFDSIQIVVDYNNNIYLKKILKEDEEVYSLF